MKVFILAALTADGFVAKNANHPAQEWTGYQDKRLFTWLTRWGKVIICGHNTYKTFDRVMSGRRVIVYTSKPDIQAPREGVEFTNEPPEQLLARLESEKVTGVAICGGLQVYSLFMKAGLVHDFYLTIQPVFFGKGLPLFDSETDMQLELSEAQVSTADNTVILHYVDTAATDADVASKLRAPKPKP